MKIDIGNINTLKKKKKVYTTKQRTIYEVIEPEFLKKSYTFSNEAINIPIEVKNKIERMGMVKVLYAQVVKLRRNDLKFIVTNKNKNEAKFKFQGKSARSQRQFDLNFDWIEVNISTLEPDLY